VFHHLHEGGLGARDVLGERHRGVVAGLHDHALDEVLDRHLLAHSTNIREPSCFPGVLADGHHVVELDASFLEGAEHAVGRHDLGEARGLLPRVRVDAASTRPLSWSITM